MARRSGLSREEIKIRALAAGAALIAQGGPHEFSMRQVAKEIGYTVGTLYNVFKNQDDLLLQINITTLKELQNFIQSRLHPNLQGKKILLNIAESYYIYARDNYARWRILFEYTLTEVTSLPEWYTKNISSLMNLAEQSLHGMGLSEIQIKITACVLWASVHGICALALSDKLALTKSEPAEKLIYDLIDKYFIGLIPESV